ncbi:MAG TPA: hypothetical protein VF796_21995, partial [Humisphaera sp.]
MRFWVAQNKTVPVWALRELANDADHRVRLMVAMKRRAPREVLESLLSDPAESVCVAARRSLDRMPRA